MLFIACGQAHCGENKQQPSALVSRAQTTLHFDIPAGALTDALDAFSEQSGLQTVYRQEDLQSEKNTAIQDLLTIEQALQGLIGDSDLTWRLVNGNTVVISAPSQTSTQNGLLDSAALSQIKQAQAASLRDMLVDTDPRRVLPIDRSALSFGFDKTLLETPRSVSLISEEVIDLFNLSAVEDLVRVVPGAYTTTRFGIQGSIDIRNVAGDTYIRGMKRLNLQGHGRSVLGAADRIEIVRGPPSPIYGMGKIGGYTNVIPKSGRARMGGFLLEPQGFFQTVIGSYAHSQISFGVGGPLPSENYQGGYYAYGLLENSGSFTKNVDIGQRVLQLAISLDEFAGPMRLEAGFNLQRSTTSGALLNRVTQELIDDQRYLRGIPLVDLDTNNNGAIGFLEMHNQSPARGQLSAENQPLIQRWPWPRNVWGEPLPLDAFPRPAGIPESLYGYLQAHPEADPDGLLRAQGIGGPQPLSGYLPVGFTLDPRTVEYAPADLRLAGAYEREVQADFAVAFFDLIYDSNPDFTLKNQVFIDKMDQYKLSEQPGGGKQDVIVFEDKLTMTHVLADTRNGLRINSLTSFNFRKTRASGYRYVGDQGSHRTDVLYRAGDMYPNATFVHPFDNNRVMQDGAPWYSDYQSDYWELGAGLLLDTTFSVGTNILLGYRHDASFAKNRSFAGTLDPFGGTSDAPLVWRTNDKTTSGYDQGDSWSVSISHPVTSGLRPYLTLAESSITLESNNNRMPHEVIEQGHIGEAELREVGIKASFLSGKLFMSAAGFEQQRLDVREDEEPVQSANVSSTQTRGWEMELKWVPLPKMFFSAYGLRHSSTFLPNYGASILVDARTLGFRDVTDKEGRVVYPAEAFLYGGRSFLELPDGVPGFETKQGNPEHQWGLSAHYQFDNGLGVLFSSNYFSEVYSGRLKQVELPQATVHNIGFFWDTGAWHLKIDWTNILNERYFRSRTGDNLGETLVSAMPGRQWLATMKVHF